ncbi:MAG: aromatic ring-hydroxylating dioxygenase subunit alpha [Comamonas sp.]
MKRLLKNTWYMIGWENELANDGKFARVVAETAIVVFRTADGQLGAVQDRCPHRFAPLSLGDVVNGNVVCPYHGLEFNARGDCVKNPFSERIPAGCRIPSYKVLAKHSVVWIWLGDQALADEALIPDYAFLVDSATNRTVCGRISVKANYEYVVDNLMDVSHIEWTHRKTFGGNGLVQQGKQSLQQNEQELWNNWWFADVPQQPIPIYESIPWERVDMWIDTRWNAPGNVMLKIGETPVGARREQGMEQLLAHMVTPVSENECHYFWGVARGINLESDGEDERLRRMLDYAFEIEDLPLIEAAAKSVQGHEFWSLKPVHLGPDSGSNRARRMLEAMIQQEQQAQTEPASAAA